MKIEIEGLDAVNATEELLRIEGLQGSYETIEEVQKEPTIATIATIVGIIGGTITIAEKIYQWYQKYKQSQGAENKAKIEKVLIVGSNGRRLLLKDATLDQIQEILGD